jgi:hypothetical protein
MKGEEHHRLLQHDIQKGGTMEGASTPALTPTEITKVLQEPSKDLIWRIHKVMGAERANALLTETLAIQAHGGMARLDGQGMRTLGGIYLSLAKDQASGKERYRIFGVPPTTTSALQAPLCTWEDVQKAISELINTPAEEASMKLTLIGRPSAVQTKGQTVVFQLKGKAPGSLPKELPPLPKTPPLTWTVIVGMRQWNKVTASLDTHPDDRLVIDGYPTLQEGQHILMANNCVSVLMQQAKKAEQRASTESDPR